MPLPTVKLDHPDYWGLINFPVSISTNQEARRFIVHGEEDLVKLLGAFGGQDWMAFKKLGQLSVDAAVTWATTFGHTLLNWVPWGFYYVLISVQPENVVIASLALAPTTEEDFNAMLWWQKINYIMSVHSINSQFILRLQNEVLTLGGKTTRGRPRIHQ